MNKFLTILNGKKYVRNLIASLIAFDNSGTSLTSTNVNDAIIEVANSTGATVDQSLDGGFANSVYTPEQCFDGGGA